MKVFRTLSIMFFTLLAVSVAVSGFAATNATLTGRIADPQGAVIAGATVEAINVDTNITSTSQTNEFGLYTIPDLLPGSYRVTVAKTGFETIVKPDVVLHTEDVVGLNFSMRVGSMMQSITVAGGAPLVETQSTQLGDVITGNHMQELPLNDRSFTNLLGLQPGVIPELSINQANAFESSGIGNLSINGQRETNNSFLINGSIVNNPLNNGSTVIPSLDSIEEFRVLTANIDPEYGNLTGGMVTLVTKAGTNAFHGDLFDYVRNEKLDSRNFFSYDADDPLTGQPIPGSARGAFKRNQFGGTLGGPIKSNRAFFFLDYEGTREIQSQASGLVLVPSAGERTGDFSDAASSLTGSVNGDYFANVLSQRLGYAVTSGEPYYSAACATTAQCVFPGAMIPHSAFSTVALNMFQYIPAPNRGPYFVSSANSVNTTEDKAGARFDLNSQRWGNINGYYSIDINSTLTPFGSNSLPGFPTQNNGGSQLWTVGDVKTLGPNALNEFHLSWTRFVAHIGAWGSNQRVDLSQLGFAPVNATGGLPIADGAFEAIPQTNVSTFSFGSNQLVYNLFVDTPAAVDNFSKVMGRHTAKFGGQYVFQNNYSPFYQLMDTPSYYFTGSETGSPFADFMLGAPQRAVIGSQAILKFRRNSTGYYAQDSWRARPDFTLNYGLRWDYIQPFGETRGQYTAFAYGAQSTILPDMPVGDVAPGDSVPGFGMVPKGISKTPLDNFAPRIGFAYSPSVGGPLQRLTGGPGKMSIRAGYGMFYGNVEGSAGIDTTGQPPFAIWDGLPSPLYEAPLTNRVTGNQSLSPTPFIPGITPFDWPANLPLSGFNSVDLHNTTPYSENYSATVERQFRDHTMLSVGYVGSVGHHLPADVPINPGDPALCLSLSQASDVAPGSPTCGPQAEDQIFTRADGTQFIGARRGPWNDLVYNDIRQISTVANSYYNALQASVRHNSKRLSLFASYTLGKSVDDSSTLWQSPLDPYNANLSKGLSMFDIEHNFVVSYQYLLPVDRLLSQRHPRLTDGWRFVGITRFTTGLPVEINEPNDLSLLAGTGVDVIDRPNYNGGDLELGANNPRSGNPYFNTAVFSTETLGQLGNSKTYFFHGPGINNWDLALHKDIPLTESKALQFRAEFFNIFNHAQFNNPTGNFLSGSFGVVTSAGAPRIGQLALKLVF